MFKLVILSLNHECKHQQFIRSCNAQSCRDISGLIMSAFEENLQKALEDLGIKFKLKEQQIEALKSLYDGRDTFCMLRTGFGKSIIYQTTPFLLGYKLDNHSTITLVISPLNSIMHDQVRSLAERGVQACALDMKCQGGDSFLLQAALPTGNYIYCHLHFLSYKICSI